MSQQKEAAPKAIRSAPRPASEIAVLHIEDNQQIARLVADTLLSEGIHVDSCMNGTTALKILKGDCDYDVIIIDNDLPGLNGLQLVRRARSMTRWRRTPIIMLSADDCEKEAWRAGVSAFLRKPEDIERVSTTITRVLEEGK